MSTKRRGEMTDALWGGEGGRGQEGNIAVERDTYFVDWGKSITEQIVQRGPHQEVEQNMRAGKFP